MKLTDEDKKLKEAMKIIKRDGKDGKFFNAAKARYLKLKNVDSIYRLSHEIDGIDWTENYKKDVEDIEAMLNTKWEDLSPERRKEIAYDWIQSEGYDAQGDEYDSPKEYYEGIATH